MRKDTGDQVKRRTERLLETLLSYVGRELKDCDHLKIECEWQDEDSPNPKLVVKNTQLRFLETLTAKDSYPGKLTTEQIRESLKRLEDFLGILHDNRTSKEKYSGIWHFKLKLWGKDKRKNIYEFKEAWKSKKADKSGKSQAQDSVADIVGKLSETSPPTLYENLGRKGVERDHFIGRDEKLKELHDLLQENSKVAITAALIGMGGVGKTELAIQYAREHLKTYQGGICWLPASDFALKLVEFARPRFFPNVNFDRFSLSEQVAYCWQHWAEGDVLLVLDDVTNYKQQVQPYLPESSRFKVLITTRERLGKPIVLLELEVLAPAEALDLLKSLLGNERVEQELDIAAELCDWLGYLPLGLDLVGRYLDHPTMQSLSIAQMLEELKEERLANEALEEANYEGMTAQLGVLDAFNLSWKRLDDNAQQLGCVLSLFALAPIPKELVERVYQSWQGKGFKPKDLRKPFWALNDLHLLKTDKETYSLHQLIRAFFREKWEGLEQADEMKQAFAATMATVAKKIPQQPTHKLIESVSLAIPHVVEVANHLTEYLSDEDLMWPFIGLGRFYDGQGFYNPAVPLLEHGLSVIQARFGSEHPTVATSISNLSSLYKSQGRYSEAEALSVQALELRQRLFGEEHSEVADSLNALGLVYCYQTRYSEAELLYGQALELRRTLFGERHPCVATSLNNLAHLYYSQGYYSEAEPLFVQALELRQHLLSEEHPDVTQSDVAQSLNNLAATYYYQGRYQEAEPLYVQALELLKCLVGEEHPDVAQSLNNLAMLYQDQDRYKEAKPLYEQAWSIYERTLGADHPNTVNCWNNHLFFLRQAILENCVDLVSLRANPMGQMILDAIQAELEQAEDASED